MKSVFLLLILISTLRVSASQANPELVLCQSYSRLNEKLGCSKQNFIVKFGQKYCETYLKKSSHFSEVTQDVLWKIRHCLINDALSDKELKCENAEERSMKSHIKCYLKSGFCEVPDKEKLLVLWYARSETTKASFRETMNAVRSACDQ